MENNIRKLRKSRDLTMKQFGEMMGVSESAISLYENNKAQPDINMMYKMADYFDVSIDFLLGRKTDESKEKKTDDKLVADILSLTEEEKTLVEGYVSGIKARRKNKLAFRRAVPLFNRAFCGTLIVSIREVPFSLPRSSLQSSHGFLFQSF